MRILSLIITLNIFLLANEYFAKSQPLHEYNVKSAVSGQVIYVNNEVEGVDAQNSIIVRLDSMVDQIELTQTNNKLKTIEQIITIEQSTLEKIQKIRSKSQLDK